MKIRGKCSRRAAAAVASVAVLLVGAAAARAGAPGATTLREPAFGLPHFFAATDVALARENGREIAKDRLGQLILLARVGRGTLAEVFAVLDPSTLDDDILARQTGYTSRELNDMFAKLPERERNIVLAYCAGVNDTIESVYAGDLPEPIEVNILRTLGFGENLFGNSANLSDQIDPYYRVPDDDPEHPTSGFQFTPELAVSIGVLEVRNFGLGGFDEPARLAELQSLVGAHGATAGAQIWDDLNFLNDPLAPVSVPDPTTPGYGAALARRAADPVALARAAARQPRFDYAAWVERRRAAAARREEFASRWGAWPKLGSYAWVVAGNRSATGYPWLGGFPQTGIQTPSIMHFAENRTNEGIVGIGMEFAGAPLILIGHTDHVAFTTTTAQLRTVETFFEPIVNENGDVLRYSDEGTPARLVSRVEILRGANEVRRVMWRSHERQGNGGSRPILDFLGDTRGTATAGSTSTTLESIGAFDGSFAGGYIAIIGGTAAGEIRHIGSVSGTDRVEVDATTPWTIPPGPDSAFVAVRSGAQIIAVAIDSPVWLEETTTVLGFALYQRAADVLDIKRGARIIPSTHNFIAADNVAFNGTGTRSGSGNIGYWSSGFSRIRLDGTDVRLPIDGSQPNPLMLARGVVASATATTLTPELSGFLGQDLSPLPVNHRYDNPTEQGREYIVTITGGTGYKQTRRIAGNDASTLTVEYPWGVIPAFGDSFEIYPIVGMPEAINPAEGYTANWNNKAATADDGDNFGRLFRHIFILERLAAETAWDRAKQRQLNADVAGLDGKGDLGRFLLPRLRQAVDAVGTGGNAAVATVLAQLETHHTGPELGRYFGDPVADTTTAGEVAFLNQLIDRLANDIYGDELADAVRVPTGSRALSMIQHAIDTAADDLPGAYVQAYAGDYFNGVDWRVAVRDSLAALAGAGIPADGTRPQSRYRHPLSALLPALIFEPTPQGNRGTYEQIVDVGHTIRGEFIFPLGQSGLFQGSLSGVTAIDPNATSLHPIWRDWRFVPMLPLARDIAANGTADADGDGIADAYETWYLNNLSHDANDDGDADGLVLGEEARLGVDPTASDTDGDGIRDGFDTNVRDRLGDSRCGGDCNGNRAVTVDELLRAVAIILDTRPLESCAVADRNGDGLIDMPELIRGVNAALLGCGV